MTADQYLYAILVREAVDTGPLSPVRRVQAAIMPLLNQWSNGYLRIVHPSGSFAKGTANLSGTDIDLFISLRPDTPDTLKQIQDTLVTALKQVGFAPRPQNVSINIKISGYSVDLVPGKLQAAQSNDHSLYRRKAGTWTKTNVATHIAVVTAAKRQLETRIIKLWRNQKSLEFPSFYLELAVIEASRSNRASSLADRVWAVFEYLRDHITSARFVDPANTNNIISDDLTTAEKGLIKAAASRALAAANWNEIVI
ncbi:MAG: nucleotidyltransferase [Rhizomicrobium sp.]